METVLFGIFATTQILYLFPLLVTIQFYARPVRWVDQVDEDTIFLDEVPRILLLYPVLREPESTMRTTMLAIANLDYPADRYRVVAIPNHDDEQSIEILGRLADEFTFLDVLEVPATSDPRWSVVWDAWDNNDKAYWWHNGSRAGVRDLPAKKTRQLIYSMYHLAATFNADEGSDWLLNYIDADSAPPRNHFRSAAAGAKTFGVMQSTNVAGNLLTSWASSFHAMDHISWDGSLWPHTSSSDKQPYWMLGKGLFYRLDDLLSYGSFNPWLTIEDPEIGMRLWANGVRMGVIADPLIEEVPVTFRDGLTQRKRWVCGFFQSLSSPLNEMGFSFRQRMRARLNFVPCASLPLNAIGVPIAIWGLFYFVAGDADAPTWLLVLNIVNLVLLGSVFALVSAAAWKRSALVLERRRERVRFVLRVNPLFLMLYWMYWTIPLAVGFNMYVRDKGLTWEPTRKVDANHDLVRREHAVDDSVPQSA